MEPRDLAEELLKTAQSDLKALGSMFDREAFDDCIFGFHAQQAVEKTLKAWLNIVGQPHPYTHDLSFLLNALEKEGVEVTSFWTFLDLSGYAIRFRYESFPEDEENLEREGLVQDITLLVEHVSKLLGCM